MPYRLFAIFWVMCAVIGPRPGAAQSVPPVPAPEQATAVALRMNASESIAVDGVLDEAAWERADPIGNFTQSEPRNVQYDSVSRVLGWQSRFRWITKPGNDIYFVWMTNWLETEDRFGTLDRNGALKLLYTYRL